MMVITRTPLRVSFIGGGSDLPAFFDREPGLVVAAAINKYIYVTVSAKYDASIRASYSVTENVTDVDELQHDLIRAALKRYGITSHIEIHSIADIPAGTGLGSSSAFTVGLVHALEERDGGFVKGDKNVFIARTASNIEITDCGHPIGYQDQFSTALGGIRAFTFNEMGSGSISGKAIAPGSLESHMLLLDAGLPPRRADSVLKAQSEMSEHTRIITRRMVSMAREFKAALLNDRMETCGSIMDCAWTLKRSLPGVTNPTIDALYATALHAGAWGGKLCGAGGSGFLLFLAPPEQHAAIIAATGLRHVPIKIDTEGTTIIYSRKENA